MSQHFKLNFQNSIGNHILEVGQEIEQSDFISWAVVPIAWVTSSIIYSIAIHLFEQDNEVISCVVYNRVASE